MGDKVIFFKFWIICEKITLGDQGNVPLLRNLWLRHWPPIMIFHPKSIKISFFSLNFLFIQQTCQKFAFLKCKLSFSEHSQLKVEHLLKNFLPEALIFCLFSRISTEKFWHQKSRQNFRKISYFFIQSVKLFTN